jgi:L-serine dehydratase
VTPEPITVRLLDLFRIGLGPSSSHTVGPMRAAANFRASCIAKGITPDRVSVDLKGSLSATGRGHGTDIAVMAGLHGWSPEDCDVDAVHALPETLAADPTVPWAAGATRVVPADVALLPWSAYRDEVLPHPNTMVCRAWADGAVVREETWCSIGGGFVRDVAHLDDDINVERASPPVLEFHDAGSLVARARQISGGLGDVVLVNELAWERDAGKLGRGLDRVYSAMRQCIDRGVARTGELPGGLHVLRRAKSMLERVDAGHVDASYAHIARAQAYAFAVNEENAAGGRVVTAPTNGAAGIVPGVLVEIADRLELDNDRVQSALATAGAIGMLVKTHASISGAEVGCQGEVGTATAMAAAMLCEILGGDPRQAEMAAEIAIEHNLGLTCDPIRGLVQAPCIERNAMGVAKAWSAAQLALHSVLSNVVSLDRVIKVMKRTGDDMRREYKETSEGGLAVSLPEC